jgi:hypothetical protein
MSLHGINGSVAIGRVAILCTGDEGLESDETDVESTVGKGSKALALSVDLLIIWHIVVRIIWHTIVPDVPAPTPKSPLTVGICRGHTFSPQICCRMFCKT